MSWSQAATHTDTQKKSQPRPNLLQNMFSFDSLAAVSTLPPFTMQSRSQVWVRHGHLAPTLGWKCAAECANIHCVWSSAGVIMDELICAMAGTSPQDDVAPGGFTAVQVAQSQHQESHLQAQKRKRRERDPREYGSRPDRKLPQQRRSKRRSDATTGGAESHELPQSDEIKSGAHTFHPIP